MLLKALLCGFYKSFWGAGLFYWGAGAFVYPLAMCAYLGLLLGDFKTGIAVGCAIQPMYLVNYNIGGTFTTDSTVACLVATYCVIVSGLSLETATALAIPIGVLGGQYGLLTSTIIGSLAVKGEVAADKGDGKGVRFWFVWFPLLFKIVVGTFFFGFMLYFGGEAIAKIVEKIPAWVNNGFAAISSIMPALGYGMVMNFIGRNEILPYFFAGFVFAAYSKLGAIAIACAGAFVAFMHVKTMPELWEEDEELGDEDTTKQRLLTQKDVRWFWLNTWLFATASHNPLQMHACGIAKPFSELAEKWYADNEPEKIALMQRHVKPYITNFNLGGLDNGAILAMEEQHALNPEAIPSDTISQVKYALAGPLAAIGDTIDSIVLMPILLGIGTSLALEGNSWACLVFPFLVGLLTSLEMYFSVMTGYKLGSEAALTILASNKIKLVIEFASVMGLFTLAGIACGMINVSLKFVIPEGNGAVLAAQTILDNIAPKLLPLGVMYACYSFLHKGGKVMTLLGIILVVGFVLGVLGII